MRDAASIDTWRIITVIAIVAIVMAYAVLSGVWVSTDAGWYQSLTKPSWQPPPWVFGVIWPYNFIALATIGSLIAWRARAFPVAVFVAFLGMSVICALVWANLFYVSHSLPGAAIALSAAALMTLPLIVVSFQTSWLFGVLLLPYQVWVILAASLSWGYIPLNTVS